MAQQPTSGNHSPSLGSPMMTMQRTDLRHRPPPTNRWTSVATNPLEVGANVCLLYHDNGL